MFLALSDGDAIVLEVRDEIRLTVITDSGATATVSRVDDPRAEEHTTGANNQFDVAPDTKTTTDVDWPYYRVSSAGGVSRVGFI